MLSGQVADTHASVVPPVSAAFAIHAFYRLLEGHLVKEGDVCMLHGLRSCDSREIVWGFLPFCVVLQIVKGELVKVPKDKTMKLPFPFTCLKPWNMRLCACPSCFCVCTCTVITSRRLA